MLYSWGRAKNYRLGRPCATADARDPEPIPEFTGVPIRQVACGGGHTCVVRHDARLFVFGYSQYGQLGLGDRQDVPHPTEVAIPHPSKHKVPILQAACGRYHTLALSDAGDVYSWGGGKNGRLGHGDGKVRVLPEKVRGFPGRVVAVACGYHSSVAVVEDRAGRRTGLYSWGWGEHGQLGHGDLDDRAEPTRVAAPDMAAAAAEILAVACGDRHGFVVTDRGELFGWGSNEFGQLGMGNKGESLLTPRRISALQGLHVVAVASGDRHSACVTNLGSVYTWGCGTDGQCGHGTFRDVGRPRLVAALSNVRVVDVVCGHNFTMAMSDTRDIYTWGNDAYGQLGRDAATHSNIPVKMDRRDRPTTRGISCAHFHCLLWTEPALENTPATSPDRHTYQASACRAALTDESTKRDFLLKQLAGMDGRI